ncbi:helix-turn-helix domain-containing protein [Cerasicoccus frondis]|uniref:helix-turn-helix domain-containing protein n=1 Tax=Cerasicoccus frondis TaxID=490090 RepID=UPI0028527352|nr:helix-turn-helix domain-containing protein [Cerasicoccus frondis]
MHLTLLELATLRNELIWIYDHEPGSLTMKANRAPEGGNWAWYLRAGELQLTQGERITTLHPGQWVLLPEGSAEHRFTPDSQLLSIHYRCQWPTGDNLIHVNAPVIIATEQHSSLLKRATRLARFHAYNFSPTGTYKTFRREQADYSNFLQLQIHFFAWLKEWTDALSVNDANWTYFKSEDERLLTAFRILNQAPLKKGLPRDQLQVVTQLSIVQLNRLFVRELGLTISKYWDRRRLEQACESLHDQSISIKELGFLLGFRSDSLFVNWFTRRKGVSPGRFRDKIANNV